MAPIKNVIDTTKKVVKKRVYKAKPDKPPLKTPTRITVKTANLSSKPPRIVRKVTCKEKIELANEVALAQLVKPSNDSKTGPNSMEPIQATEGKVISRPNRKRKLASKLVSEESDSDMPLAKTSAESTTGKTKTKSKKETVSRSPLKSSNDSELATVETIKKPGPKSKTLGVTLDKRKSKVKLETLMQDSSIENKKSTIKPVATRSKKEIVGKQQQKVIPNYFSEKQTHEVTGQSEDIRKTPVKRVNKRKQTSKTPENKIKDPKKTIKGTAAKNLKETPKSKTVCARKLKNTQTNKKGKCMNAKEIKAAALRLDNALGNGAAPVHTRSSSVGSTNSNLSWTRDISTATSLTSGTTSCVTVSSSDFVRFDKKLPFVQVINTNLDKLKVAEDAVPKKLLESDSSSSNSDSESSESPSEFESDVPDSKPELNLSTSSLSQSEGMMVNTELLSLEIDKLNISLRNFYAEMNKWIVFDDDESVTFSAILEAANLEKDIISNCEHFNSILDAVKFDTTKISTENKEANPNSVNTGLIADCNRENCEVASPVQRDPKGFDVKLSEHYGDRPSSVKSHDNVPININLPVARTSTPRLDSPENSINSSETFTNDNCNYLPFDDNVYCDDEDALSIFDLESITGVESSRLSSASVTNMSAQETYVSKPTQIQEAYVPKPTRTWLQERYTYKPTRIDEYIQDTSLKTIQPNMIERKNADSSSISKEMDINRKAANMLDDANRLSSIAEGSIKTADIEQVNKPLRMFVRYQPVNAVKSALYRGHCFFNLSSQCKNIMNCRFPHVDIDPNLIKTRLVALSEDNLIEEYLLTCHFNNLRRKYALLFIQECKRRESTRMLMEMAIDLGLGVLEREDNTLIVNVLETTLLHLNKISFDACDDMLIFKHKGKMLCDALLSCMADSQNFAQFKRAFVKLANFMAQIKRSVDIQVVGKILERVCILPGEDSLARGMLCLMQNTESRIFENTMTKSFEVQLSNIESDVHEAYLLAKKAAVESQLDRVSDSAVQSAVNPRAGREGPRHTSPDTTIMDCLKQAQMAQPTTFKRTIDTEAIRHLFKSPCHPAPKPRFTGPAVTQWRRGRGYPMRPALRGGRFNTGAVRMASVRRVYRTPAGHRNGANT